MPANDHLVVFDTTLRDGVQSPGTMMKKAEKRRIARILEKLRVDVIGHKMESEGRRKRLAL